MPMQEASHVHPFGFVLLPTCDKSICLWSELSERRVVSGPPPAGLGSVDAIVNVDVIFPWRRPLIRLL